MQLTVGLPTMERSMAVLDLLSLSDAAPKRDTSPTGRFRRKIMEAIDLQIAMVEAQAAGTELKRTRNRRVKNEAGVKELREVPVRLRPWWWTDDAGTTFLSLRHGGRAMAIAPGKTAIEVGAFADLTAKLAILRDAVRAGELDACREEATPRTTKKNGKAGEKAAASTAPGKAVPGRPPRKAENASGASVG